MHLGLVRVYRAMVDRQVKGQGWQFFLRRLMDLHFCVDVKGISQGDNRSMYRSRAMQKLGKAIPVTQKLLFKSRYAIVTPDAAGINLSA